MKGHELSFKIYEQADFIYERLRLYPFCTPSD